ncbi:hypothetical protein ACFE04_004079 [Oxalis oulophora]
MMGEGAAIIHEVLDFYLAYAQVKATGKIKFIVQDFVQGTLRKHLGWWLRTVSLELNLGGDHDEYLALANMETTLQVTFLQVQDLNVCYDLKEKNIDRLISMVSYLKKFCERVQADATTSQ